MSKKDVTLDYYSEPTINEFHLSDKFYRLLIGPVGSGKSTGCCMELMRRAMQQRPSQDGIRRSRVVVVRNTYRELKDTTVKTWLDWFPEDYFGPVNKQEMTHRAKFKDVDLEVLFRALDRPGDIKKVLSLEVTAAWLNEVREIPKGIVDAVGDRVGRYPAVKDGGCTWSGVIADTNPPDEDHWIYRIAEEERPDNWAVFRQPGGVIEVDGEFFPHDGAENLAHLEADYYKKRLGGKSKDWIRVYYCGQYGFVREGKPVHPEYVDAVHCAHDVIPADPKRPLYIGVDFGLTPAAVFAQQDVRGRWYWIDELVTEDMGCVRFAELLSAKLTREYAGYETEIWGDPAGDERAQTDESTPFKILQAAGIDARKCFSNDPVIRRESVSVPLGRLIDGKPGLMLSPKCKVTRKGMAGGYCYRRVQIAGDERYHDKPDKNRYSHPVEAGEYLMVGAGEGRALTATKGRVKVVVPRPPRRLTRSNSGWMGV